jgi:hypothetical protein
MVSSILKEFSMKENCQNSICKKLFAGFCIVELLLLIALKIVEAICTVTLADTFIMFFAILLNALFMFYAVMSIKKAGKDPAIIGIPLAVFITLLADLFLVFLNDLAEGGVIGFISANVSTMIGFLVFGMVQVVYAYHLGLTKRRVIIRVGFYLAFIVVVAVLNILTLDRFIACLSMSQLILNLIYGWIEHKKKNNRTSLLLAIGLTLFFGCDFFIMLRMLLPASGFIYAFICFMVWVFYIPSQVILTTTYLSERNEI